MLAWLAGALSWPSRTDWCGSVGQEDVGRQVTVCGWVHRYRNMGGVVFADVRDSTGLLQARMLQPCAPCMPAQQRADRCMRAQIVGQPEHHADAAEACNALRNEWVVRVSGKLAVRQNPNPKLPTGQYELLVEQLDVLNRVHAKLPFTPADEFVQKEETRLRHRVLDIRYV